MKNKQTNTFLMKIEFNFHTHHILDKNNKDHVLY